MTFRLPVVEYFWDVRDLGHFQTTPLALRAPPFDLAENLAQCRQFHREKLSIGSKVGRSLGSTCGGQRGSVYAYAKNMRETITEGPIPLLILLPSLLRNKMGLFFDLQVNPSDLPTFDTLRSCSL
jgi:hypothetical protein